MKLFNCLFILFVLFSACNTVPSKNNTVMQIPEVKYIIPDTLYSFFPTQTMVNYKPLVYISNAGETDLPYFAESFTVTYILNAYEVKDSLLLEKTKKEFTNQSIFKYNTSDSNYFIIGSEPDMLTLFDTLQIKKKYALQVGKPLILNFHNLLNDDLTLYDKNTICGLPSDYEILVLKTGSQFVLPLKYQTNWGLLPNGLKHGYSSGIAFNATESNILYWVVAW